LVDYIDMVGMSGYAQAEASKTIQGSLASMKGAWSNLLTGMSDDNADFGLLVNNFVDSVGTVAENILPRVQIALTGVGDLIDGLFPVIVEKIPAIIEDTLPKLAESAVKIVESLINGISQNQDTLLTTAFSVIMTLVNGITSLLPQILQLGLSLIITLATGIAENVDTLLPAIIDTVIGMYEMLTNPEQLSKLLDAALVLITELAFGLVEAIPQLTDSVLNIIVSLVTFLTTPENLAKLVNAALKLVIALGGGLIAAIPRLLEQNALLIKSLIDNFKETDWGEVGKNIIDGLLGGLKKAWESIKTWFTNAWNNLFGNRSVDVSANVSGGGVDGSHAGGLDYVPFDGYVAELHKGEQVLTAEEARDYKRGGKVVNVVQNIYSQAKTSADLMQEAIYQQEKAVIFGV
jgi:phage-related protein